MTSPLRPPFPLPLLRFWFRRLLLMWSLIAFMIFITQVIVCATVHDSEMVKVFQSFIKLMPKAVTSLIGGDALQTGNATAFIAIGYQHPMVLLLFMFFAVATPSGLLAGEVQQGRMELILSRSVTKMQSYLCVAALTITGMFALVLAMFSGTVVGVSIFDFGDDLSLYPFFILAVNGGLLASAVAAISLLSSAIFRRRNMAIGTAAGYLIVNYLIWVTSQWWAPMKPLEPITPYWYVDGIKIFTEQAWPIGDMCVLISLMIVAAVAGAIVWRRRDLPL